MVKDVNCMNTGDVFSDLLNLEIKEKPSAQSNAESSDIILPLSESLTSMPNCMRLVYFNENLYSIIETSKEITIMCYMLMNKSSISKSVVLIKADKSISNSCLFIPCAPSNNAEKTSDDFLHVEKLLFKKLFGLSSLVDIPVLMFSLDSRLLYIKDVKRSLIFPEIHTLEKSTFKYHVLCDLKQKICSVTSLSLCAVSHPTNNELYTFNYKKVKHAIDLDIEAMKSRLYSNNCLLVAGNGGKLLIGFFQSHSESETLFSQNHLPCSVTECDSNKEYLYVSDQKHIYVFKFSISTQVNMAGINHQSVSSNLFYSPEFTTIHKLPIFPVTSLLLDYCDGGLDCIALNRKNMLMLVRVPELEKNNNTCNQFSLQGVMKKLDLVNIDIASNIEKSKDLSNKLAQLNVAVNICCRIKSATGRTANKDNPFPITWNLQFISRQGGRDVLFCGKMKNATELPFLQGWQLLVRYSNGIKDSQRGKGRKHYCQTFQLGHISSGDSYDFSFIIDRSCVRWLDIDIDFFLSYDFTWMDEILSEESCCLHLSSAKIDVLSLLEAKIPVKLQSVIPYIDSHVKMNPLKAGSSSFSNLDKTNAKTFEFLLHLSKASIKCLLPACTLETLSNNDIFRMLLQLFCKNSQLKLSNIDSSAVELRCFDERSVNLQLSKGVSEVSFCALRLTSTDLFLNTSLHRHLVTILQQVSVFHPTQFYEFTLE